MVPDPALNDVKAEPQTDDPSSNLPSSAFENHELFLNSAPTSLRLATST